PEKPPRFTPVRAFWPLTPRPQVLPLVQPMPRPTTMRFLRAPRLSLRSFNFILLPLCFGAVSLRRSFLNFHEVLDARHHATHGGRIFQLARIANPAQAKPEHGLAHAGALAIRAGGLDDGDGFLGCRHDDLLFLAFELGGLLLAEDF